MIFFFAYNGLSAIINKKCVKCLLKLYIKVIKVIKEELVEIKL